MPGFSGNVVRAFLAPVPDSPLGQTPPSPSVVGASWTDQGVSRDWGNVYGYLNGSWKRASDVYTYHSGQWKKVWVGVTAPTTVTASVTSGTRNGTLSWSGAVGASGYYVYRSDAVGPIETITNPNTTSTAITLPQYETNYTYSVASYFSTYTTTPTAASPVKATLPAPAVSASLSAGWGYSTINNYAAYGHTTPDYPISNPQMSVSWSAISGVSQYNIYHNGVFSSSTSSTSTVVSSGTSVNVTVRAVAPNGVVGPSSATATLNVGAPRSRALSSETHGQPVQGSAAGTTNGQHIIQYPYTASIDPWVYKINFQLSIPTSFSPYVTNWDGRRINLIYPGVVYEVPNNSRETYSLTVSSVFYSGTIVVNPYYTGGTSGWTIAGSTTNVIASPGFYRARSEVTVYYSYVTNYGFGPSVTVG